ncbi:MAG TPA: hypothetical protein VFR15_12770 [Chloroflexia bacterium]|nr:hypothetical protein [Chloroflexia bacterium]
MQSATLSPGRRKLLLTTHIAATVSVLGADLVLLLLGLAGLGGTDQRTIYPAAHLVGTWLVTPLAFLSLGTGLLLGLLTTYGLLKYWWVAIKLVITTALTGAVLLVLVPRLASAAEAVTGPSPRFLAGGEQLALVLAPAAASTLLLLNVAFAVYKPGWRLQSRSVSTAAPYRAQPEPE